MTLSGAPTAARTRGLSLRRRTLYPTELWMQGTVLPLVFSAIARFHNQTHADRCRQNRYKTRASQSFDRLPSKSLFWLPWWTSFPFGHSLILHFICIFCYSAVSNRRFLRRRTLYPAELWMHTTYGDCEKYPSIIIREKKGKVNSFWRFRMETIFQRALRVTHQKGCEFERFFL